MSKHCPPLSVYDCRPNLQTFLHDFRVSGKGITRDLGEFFPLSHLANAVQDDLSVNIALGHAARIHRDNQLTAQHATNYVMLKDKTSVVSAVENFISVVCRSRNITFPVFLTMARNTILT